MGRDYYAQLCRYEDIEIVAWFDSDWRNCRLDYADVKGPGEIPDRGFDKIIVAVEEEAVAEEIRDILLNCGLPGEGIIWSEPQCVFDI